MCKFDTSSGLTKKQIDIIKYAVKGEILSWSLNGKDRIESKGEITLGVVAKLKKEFHQYNESTHYKYSCEVKLRQDIYRPKITITKTCITK